MKTTRLIMVAAVATVAFGFTLAFAPSYTPLAGGSGGTAYMFRCGQGEVLVGLTGNAGQWIDLLKPVCAKPSQTDGSWSSSHELANAVAGKNHFATTATGGKCPGGQAIKSISGRDGMYVNSIAARCYKLGAGARTGDATGSFARMNPLADGTAYGVWTCPSAQPAVGVHGKEGEFVDAFGLICDYVQ